MIYDHQPLIRGFDTVRGRPLMSSATSAKTCLSLNALNSRTHRD